MARMVGDSDLRSARRLPGVLLRRRRAASHSPRNTEAGWRFPVDTRARRWSRPPGDGADGAGGEDDPTSCFELSSDDDRRSRVGQSAPAANEPASVALELCHGGCVVPVARDLSAPSTRNNCQSGSTSTLPMRPSARRASWSRLAERVIDFVGMAADSHVAYEPFVVRRYSWPIGGHIIASDLLPWHAGRSGQVDPKGRSCDGRRRQLGGHGT